MAYTTIYAIQVRMLPNRNAWRGKVFSRRVLASDSSDKNGKEMCFIFMLKKLTIDMFDPIFRIISTIAHGVLVGITSISATALGAIADKRLGRRVSRHDSFTVTLGSSYGFFLMLPPGPTPTHLFCLGKFLRRLMKSFAFFSHDRNITHNP